MHDSYYQSLFIPPHRPSMLMILILKPRKKKIVKEDNDCRWTEELLNLEMNLNAHVIQ